MHHHTENESSLFSCLVFFSFVSPSLSVSVFFSLSSFSVSVSVWCCGRDVVCGLWCVWCGVCPLNTSPCVHSTRHRENVQNVPVYAGTTHMLKSMWAWCRYTRRRFESTHGGFQRATPHGTTAPRHHGTTHHTHHTHVECVSSVKQVIFKFLEHKNQMLGSCLIANFQLTKICPHRVIT